MAEVFVGAGRLDLHVPEAGSLKARRAVLNKAIAALRRDLDVSVAQVDDTEQWQRASIAVAVVASTPAGVERVRDRLVAVVERDPRVVVVAHRWDDVDLDLDGATLRVERHDLRSPLQGLPAQDQELLDAWTEDT